MRIDLDQRLAFSFVIAWAVVIGSGIVGAVGGHVPDVVVATAGTVILGTLGIGAVVGTGRQIQEDQDHPPPPPPGGQGRG